MKMITRRTLTLTALLLLAITALAMMAGALILATIPTAPRLNNRGNDDYAREAFEEALADYQKAQITEPELAEPYYNAANALYRRGAYAAALEQLQVALSFAAEDELAEKGFFNLGNNFFNQEQMEAAVAAFKEALLRDPADQDAKYNLELALQTQQEQEQQQQQQQEEEQQDDQNQENQEENQDTSEDSSAENQEQNDSAEGQEASPDNANDEEQESPERNGREEDQETAQNGAGQPDNGEETGENANNPAEIIDGQLTEEQAEQLLNAIAAEAQTLQEALDKILIGPSRPPVQDW